MIEKIVDFLKSIDDPEGWAYMWWFPAIAFGVGTVKLVLIGLYEPAGWAAGAAITCAVGYNFNLIMAKLLEKPDNT